MYRRYKAAGVVLGAIFMAMVSMDTQAAQLGEDLSVGIASTFDQTTNTEEETPYLQSSSYRGQRTYLPAIR